MIVPCCWKCAFALHARRLGRTLLISTIAVAAFMLVFLPNAPRDLILLIIAGIIGSTTFGLATLRRLYPPRFDLTAGRDLVTFGFQDLSLGYEFRAMNPDAREAGGLTSA